AVALALAFCVALGIATFHRIAHPIRGLESAVTAIAAGDYGMAVPSTDTRDEIGSLARSIEILAQGAAKMEEQRWVKANVAALGASLQGTISLDEFGQRLLSRLVPLLGGGVAGFYQVEPDSERLRRIAIYGLAEDANGAGAVFEPGEGLVGKCAREGVEIALTDLPPDYLAISSGLGKAPPRQVTAWPLTFQGALLAVLEVGSFRALQPTERALLDESLPMVATSLAILERNLNTAAQQEEIRHQHFLADSALDLTKAGHWHVPLDGSGWYNSSERAARIFGDL